MIYGLPKSLEVNGKEYAIRTDFRDIMTVIYAFNDPNLENKEKVFVCLYVIYEDFEDMEAEDYEAAYKAASDFINHGMSEDKSVQVKMIDFEQDEMLLVPAVNRVAGFEVRDVEYMHWWTFMGYFMEIGECTYSQILNIRSKRAHHKKLEKWEQEFFDRNKKLCIIQERLSDEEIAQRERIKKMLS